MVTLGLSLWVIAWSGAAAVAQTMDHPLFRLAPCDVPDVTATLESRLQCGTVAVPRDRGAPAAGSFQLAVVVIKADTDRKQPDPVVYISGGPGSPLTRRAATLARHEAAVVAPDRDLILIDQRGAGRSEPALCPWLALRQLEIFASGSEQQELVNAWRESYAACRRDMAAHGLKPEWFGTRLTTADFDSVRQALGIGRWNIYSLSYGTAVAMTMMALYPDSLRAVVLDSVFPPDLLPMTLSQTFSHALDLLFTACRSNVACALAHPDLAATFDAALLGLDNAPLTVPLSPGLGIKTFKLRAQVFRLIVNRALYSREAIAALPSFIEAARDRRPTAMQGLIDRIAKTYLDMSIGDMAAVECRERPSWQKPATPNDSNEPPVSAFVAGMCANWSPLGPPPLIAQDTAIPALLLAGIIDPITPPAFARIAATRMGTHATMVEFPYIGHGVQQASPCSKVLITAFIENPSSKIDTTCTTQALSGN